MESTDLFFFVAHRLTWHLFVTLSESLGRCSLWICNMLIHVVYLYWEIFANCSTYDIHIYLWYMYRVYLLIRENSGINAHWSIYFVCQLSQVAGWVKVIGIGISVWNGNLSIRYSRESISLFVSQGCSFAFQRLFRKRAITVKLSKVGSFRRNSAASLFDTSEGFIIEQEMWRRKRHEILPSP